MYLLVIIIIVFTFGSVSAAPLVDGGPNDYYDTTRRIQEVARSVERLHLNEAIKHFRNNRIELACGELDFTLRWFPNHPKGLQFATELLSKHSCRNFKSGDEYFSAALKFRPDGTIHTLYGILLHRKGKLDKALKHYESALSLVQDSADLHYNMGLLFVENKQYQKALKHAEKAYELGHPLPGLRNKLINLEVWPQNTTK